MVDNDAVSGDGAFVAVTAAKRRAKASRVAVVLSTVQEKLRLNKVETLLEDVSASDIVSGLASESAESCFHAQFARLFDRTTLVRADVVTGVAALMRGTMLLLSEDSFPLLATPVHSVLLSFGTRQSTLNTSR